jgi:hypothetical protein
VTGDLGAAGVGNSDPQVFDSSQTLALASGLDYFNAARPTLAHGITHLTRGETQWPARVLPLSTSSGKPYW